MKTLTSKIKLGILSSFLFIHAQILAQNNALDFDNSQYVNIPHDPLLDLAGDFTVEFWFNHTTIGNVIIIEKGSNNQEWSIQQSSGLKILLNIGNTTTSTNGTYNDGNWHHAAVVYRGANDASIYIDGVDDTGVASVGTPDYVTYDGDINIGGRGASNSYNGLLDEVRIWDDERTIGEIQANRYNTLVGNEANLVSYFPFDETSGTNLPDLSGNGLDGTLMNMTGTEWAASGALRFPIYNATAVNTSEFTANWEAIAGGADDLTIEWGTGGSFANNTVLIGGSQNGSSSVVSASLTAGTVYEYRIKATVGGAETGYTEERSFMVEPGYALDFDGTADYIELFESDIFVGDFTIEAWIYLTDFSDYRPLISKQGTSDNNTAEFNFQVQGPINGNLSFFLGTGSGIADVSGNNSTDQDIQLNTWTHVAAVVDGTNMYLYIDGVLSGSSTFSGIRQNTTAPVRVAQYNNAIAQYWPGSLDEIRIWDYARNATEIADNTYSTLTGQESGLTGYYRFDET
ncbi:MAG: LamG domain-containing protein, partial [Cyclobacteriaceae bacterium]